MANYTLLSLEEANAILALYGQPKVLKIEPLSLGISNSNYKLSLEGRDPLLLKISNDKGKSDLEDEQKILLSLKKAHFQYSLAPYLTLKNETVYTWKNYYGVLLPFINGSAPNINLLTMQKLGQTLAQLHQTRVPLEGLRKHNKVGFDAEEILNYLKQKDCPSDFKQIFSELFPDSLQKYLSASLATGLIHGDLYFDNVLMDQGEVVSVLDFEQAGVGPYLFDLGVAISGTCLKNGSIDLDLVEAYREGYEKIRPLPKLESELFSTSILLGFYSIALWRIKRFNEKSLDPNKFNNYKELINKAQSFYQLKKKL